MNPTRDKKKSRGVNLGETTGWSLEITGPPRKLLIRKGGGGVRSAFKWLFVSVQGGGGEGGGVLYSETPDLRYSQGVPEMST